MEGGSSSTFRIIRIFKITRPVVMGSDGQLACQRENLDDATEQTLCGTSLTDLDNPKCVSWATESLSIVQYRGHFPIASMTVSLCLGGQSP